VAFMQYDRDGRDTVAVREKHCTGAEWIATLDAAVHWPTTEPFVHRNYRTSLYKQNTQIII